MSDFLGIMQAVARNAGIEQVASITASDPDHVLLAQLINEAGAEVARRADWSALRRTASLAGTGAPGAYSLPDDFDRLVPGLGIACGWAPVRGSLTPDEWASCPSVIGVPRYFFLTGRRVEFYPYPRTVDTLRALYQSRFWTLSDGDTLTIGSDTPLVPSELLEAGAIWRWRRHVGKDFADHLAEFEARLADLARSDAGVRQP